MYACCVPVVWLGMIILDVLSTAIKLRWPSNANQAALLVEVILMGDVSVDALTILNVSSTRTLGNDTFGQLPEIPNQAASRKLSVRESLSKLFVSVLGRALATGIIYWLVSSRPCLVEGSSLWVAKQRDRHVTKIIFFTGPLLR